MNMATEDLKGEIKFVIGDRCYLDDLIEKISHAHKWEFSFTKNVVNEIITNDSSFSVLNNEVYLREDSRPTIQKNQNPYKNKDIKEFIKSVGMPKDCNPNGKTLQEAMNVVVKLNTSK